MMTSPLFVMSQIDTEILRPDEGGEGEGENEHEIVKVML